MAARFDDEKALVWSTPSSSLSPKPNRFILREAKRPSQSNFPIWQQNSFLGLLFLMTIGFLTLAVFLFLGLDSDHGYASFSFSVSDGVLSPSAPTKQASILVPGNLPIAMASSAMSVLPMAPYVPSPMLSAASVVTAPTVDTVHTGGTAHTGDTVPAAPTGSGHTAPTDLAGTGHTAPTVPASGLHTTPRCWSSPSNQSIGFPAPSWFQGASGILRSNGYSMVAMFLDYQWLGYNEDSMLMIVFASIDLAMVNVTPDPSIFLRHVVPCKLLWSELVSFNGDSTVLPIFLDGFSIKIGRLGNVLVLNGAPVFYANMYFSDTLVVHGILEFLELPEPKPEDAIEGGYVFGGFVNNDETESGIAHYHFSIFKHPRSMCCFVSVIAMIS